MDDGKYFVEGQLISKHDFFYKSQQQSTYFYENVVPMWKSVAEGNWRHVSNIVRKLGMISLSKNCFVISFNDEGNLLDAGVKFLILLPYYRD